MAHKVVSMETKLLAVFAGGATRLSTKALCEDLEISRQTFYKYRKRWQQLGPAGLVEQSRRPKRSPQMISAALEDEIVRLRKSLPLDHGAQTIAYHLERAGWPVPSVATVHRALVRRGLVDPQPQKRPKSAWRRFEWPRPNDAWQIDATQWVLRSGREIWIMDLLDDHSRVALSARVCGGPTGEAAWGALCDASVRWALPAHVMSDNGACFTARFRHDDGEADFERHLRALGVRHILSTPGHPQTCGKLERFHQTLKRWLRQRPLARSPRELQHQLDVFLDYYNHARPHRALAGATPAERWHATPPAQPGEAIPAPPDASLRDVRSGKLHYRKFRIGIPPQHRGTPLLVIARGDDLAIFGPHGIVRRLTLDRTRSYQPSGHPPGRPKTKP
jgi:transposase InsO family protein